MACFPGAQGCLDTSSEAARVQIDLLRQAGPARRFHLACSLSDTCLWLARRALRRSMPDAAEREVQLAFVSLWYGEDLAQRVRRYLEQRESQCPTS